MAKTNNRTYIVSWRSSDYRRSGLQRVSAPDRASAVSKLRKRVKGGKTAFVSAVIL